ncbi:hypothetical protein [Thiobacillus sp.]
MNGSNRPEADIDCSPESGSWVVLPELFHDSEVDWGFLLTVMDVMLSASGAYVCLAAIFLWRLHVERRRKALSAAGATDCAAASRRTGDKIECHSSFG